MTPASGGLDLTDRQRTWDSAELDQAVSTWADEFAGAGFAAHQPVALVGHADAPTVAALLALRRAGAGVVLLHPRLTAPELRASQERASASVLLSSRRVGGIPSGSAIVLPSVGERPRLPAVRTSAPRLPADFILYTSGTEGRPKAVLLNEAGFDAHTLACRGRLEASSEDRWLLTITPSHVGGLAMILRARQLGATLVLPEIEASLETQIRSQSVTHASIVPTQLRRWMAERKDASATPGLRCVLVGGAPVPRDLQRRALQVGIPVRPTYGLTETYSQVATATSDAPLGSVGPPLPGVEVRFDPEQTILVRARTLMKAYYRDAPATASVLQKGWLRTGDIGHADEAGHVWVTGRRSNLIVTGGEKVDPAEVESVLESHPAVEESCVVGMPDAEWGETVTAAVVLREGRMVGVEELRHHCRASLANFKIPRRIEFLPALPRTPTGKIVCDLVRERLRVPP